MQNAIVPSRAIAPVAERRFHLLALMECTFYPLDQAIWNGGSRSGSIGTNVPTVKQLSLNPPGSFADLEQLIGARHAGLSSRLKDIAVFALAHPNTIALETVATVAEQAGVPPSALVRFAQALGFDGFSDMQRLFRLRLVEQMPSYAERLAQRDGSDGTRGDSLDQLAAAAHRAIDDLAAETPRASLAEAAERLAGAQRIDIVAQRRSLPVASYLLYGLLNLERPTRLIDNRGGMLAQYLRSLDAADVMLAVSFKPYAPETLEAVRAAAERGLGVVVVTDLPVSPLTAFGKPTLFVRDAELQQVRSLAAAMCLATCLVIETGHRLVARRLKEQTFQP
jgi:DNA-binding MurR/RpiR family transcriptional regulator